MPSADWSRFSILESRSASICVRRTRAILRGKNLKKIVTIAVTLVIALLFGTVSSPEGVRAQALVDYDTDDDGLIEVEWLEQLDAIRWDLDGDGFVDEGKNAETYTAAFPNASEGMGCPDWCRGYELKRDLNFKNGRSYASGAVNDRWTRGNGWLPIGLSDAFHAEFHGNGSTITNLYIDRTGDNQPEYSGLFGQFGGMVTHLNIVGVDVTGREQVGALAAVNHNTISFVQASGSVTSEEYSAGGLVGQNGGTISHSTFSGSVSSEAWAGGLVGANEGEISNSNVDSEVSSKHISGGLAAVNYREIRYSSAGGGPRICR